MIKVDEKKIIIKPQGCAPHIFSFRLFGIFWVHLHSASTHHSSPVKWVQADTISVLSFCGGYPFPTPGRPSPRRRANNQTNSRGVFHGTIPASAGLWSHRGLTTVSSLTQPISASLLPKNGRRNPFLRWPAALQTLCAPKPHRRVCIKVCPSDFIGSFTPPKSKRLQRLQTKLFVSFQCPRLSTCKYSLHL